MSLEISRETEMLLTEEARRQGVSVDVLLERFINELGATVPTTGIGDQSPNCQLFTSPGPMGALHRRDIYDDGR